MCRMRAPPISNIGLLLWYCRQRRVYDGQKSVEGMWGVSKAESGTVCLHDIDSVDLVFPMIIRAAGGSGP